MHQDTPTTVRRAVYLLWASLIIGLLTSAPEFVKAGPDESAIATGIILAFSFGLPGLIILFIQRGHNWARIVMLLMTIAGLTFVLWWPFEGEPEPLWSTALNVVITAMDIAAIYLLFTAPSNQWFRTHRSSGRA